MNIERIQQAVREKDISITELTKELGINRRTWYRWINGDMQPTYKNVVKLCKVLNIDIREIAD